MVSAAGRIGSGKPFNLVELKNLFDVDNQFLQTKQEYIKQNWLLEVDNQIKLTQEGQLRADFIASEFFRV